MATNYPTFQSDPTLNSVTASSGVSGSSGIFNSITGTNISATNNLYVGSNLGVGTTATTYKLDVAGTGRFTSNFEVTGTVKSTSTIFAPGIDLSSSTGYANIEIGGPSGGHIDLKRPYTDDYDIRLISDNNIEGGGYLLNAGGAMLSLSGSGVAVGQYSSAGYKFLVGGTTRLANTVEIGQSGTLSLYDNATQVVVQYPNKQVSFYDSTNTATRMLIDINGNVGIGTTNPARPLQVGNESGQQVVRIAGGSGGTASGSALYLGAGSGLDIYALGHYSAINGGAYNDTLTLYAADGRPVYMQCGNVGIGTSTPAYKLDVAGTGRFTSNVEITGTLKGITELTASVISASSYLGIPAGGSEGAVYVGNKIISGSLTVSSSINTLSSITSSGDILVNGLWLGRGRLSNNNFTVAFGFDALSSSVGSTYNTAIGNSALKNTTGNANTGIGGQAASANTTGTSNTALGTNSLLSSITGSGNTAIGAGAIRYLTTGSNNIALGSGAGLNLSLTALEQSVIIGGYNGSGINGTTGSIIISDGGGNIRIQANNTGLVTIPGTLSVVGGQIKFPATQIASADANTLDDYEEGTWTPELSASTTNNYSYTSQSGRYIKIGRLVTCYGHIRLSSTGSSSGFVSVSALPFSGNSFGTLYVDYMNAFSASVTTPIRGQTGLFSSFSSFSLLFGNDTSLQNTNLTNTSGFTFFISYQATS